VLWAAENNQNKQVIDLIIALSKFYKLTLGKGLEAVAVASEAEHIQSYLTIMSMRYADILEYEVSVDESVMNGLFPPIILQPIVENCIYHGIKNKRFGQNEKGMVTIGITRHDEEKILIRINDNGIGMEPEFLARLKGCLEQNGASKSGGYGLINVKQRLNLFFGRDISFDITSRKDFGTEFEILVPYKEN
jgi:two-component system sensor histidine kinase YesM